MTVKYIDFQTLYQAVKWDVHGLSPVIVQDARTRQVLTLAYMNATTLQMSYEKGETIFWSRSRQSVWHKGETSGHTQRIVSFGLDCDGDALLVQVVPAGPACHTGSPSCFFQFTATEGADYGDVLSNLEQKISQRNEARPEGSYTTYLFQKGIDKICKKVGEETAEVIIAAKNRDPLELRAEVSDLIFHLLVLLREQNVPWQQILQELHQRNVAK